MEAQCSTLAGNAQLTCQQKSYSKKRGEWRETVSAACKFVDFRERARLQMASGDLLYVSVVPSVPDVLSLTAVAGEVAGLGIFPETELGDFRRKASVHCIQQN
jgi:hypothetical protein